MVRNVYARKYFDIYYIYLIFLTRPQSAPLKTTMAEVLYPNMTTMSIPESLFLLNQKRMKADQGRTTRSSGTAHINGGTTPNPAKTPFSSASPRTTAIKRVDSQTPIQSLAFVEGLRDLQDTSTRTLIRTHVMKDVVRQKGKPPRTSDHSILRATVPVVGRKQKFRLKAESMEPYQRAKDRQKAVRKRGANSSPAAAREDGQKQHAEAEEDHSLGPPPISIAADSQNRPQDAILSIADNDIINWFEETDNNDFPEERSELAAAPASECESYMRSFGDLASLKLAPEPDSLVAWTSPYDMEQISTSRLDPFHSLPVRLDHYAENLIDQCKYTITLSHPRSALLSSCSIYDRHMLIKCC